LLRSSVRALSHPRSSSWFDESPA